MRSTVAVIVVVVAAAIAACSSPGDGSASSPATSAPASSAVAAPVSSPAPPTALVASPNDPRFIDVSLPLLPDNLPYAARPADVVRTVYAFAAHHPEVLRYVPCFCGCERMGHHANDECFIAKRSATGKVVEWQPHGVICEICLDVAREAIQLHDTGASVEQIRTTIDRKWTNQGASHTNTPMPPHSGRP